MARDTIRRLLVLFAVPALACSIFARQVYLQAVHDLSVWKGGGMGMFAGIGAPHHRFLKVFLVDPLGQRILTVRFTKAQAKLVSQARSEPIDRRFDRLARSLLATRWKLLRETVAGLRIDSKGRRIGMERTPHLSVAPVSITVPTGIKLSPAGAGWLPGEVEIEFWKIGYEVRTKRLFAKRERSFEVARGQEGR